MDKAKIEALEGCVALWGWLAGDGNRDKGDWPGWGIRNRVPYDCFFCGYVMAPCNVALLPRSACKEHCPMAGRWGEKGKMTIPGDDGEVYIPSVPCEAGLYGDWMYSQDNGEIEEAAKAAGKIRDIALELLEKERK